MVGKVLAVNIAEKRGQKKHNIDEAYLKADLGIGIDAHQGDWHHQISLLSLSSFEKMRAQGINVEYGGFAENITVGELDLIKLPPGTRLKVGDSLLEITQIGKECHNQSCTIKKQAGSCIMPVEGVFARVLESGWIKRGDSVEPIQ